MGRVYKVKNRLELWDDQGKHQQAWRGRASDSALAQYIQDYIDSLQIGGVNEHISRSLGYIPVPHKAYIINQNTEKVVARWEAPAFMAMNPSEGKFLFFRIRGEDYVVNRKGELLQRQRWYHKEPFSGDWKIFGFAKRWNARPSIFISQAFENPSILKGTYVYDVDHGTLRSWGGSYGGKLPRITSAYVGND